MAWELAGLGNALMDALVVVDDDAILDELNLVRGTMHPVDHDRWQQVYERIREHRVTFDAGGSCANTIATAGRLGARAIYSGQVGDDQMGHQYAAYMERACGQHALHFTRERATGKCLSIISAKDAERTMLTDLGAAVCLPGLGDFANDLADTRYAHFTGYTLLPGPMQAVALEAMAHAKAAGAIVSLDVADPFVIGLIRDVMWQTLRDHVDIVFLNAEEAHGLSGRPAEEAAHDIAERAGVATTVVKLGGRGSIILDRGELHTIDIRRVKAVDTTGAGDAYAGGFLYGMVKGWSVARAGNLASHVAALTVSQIGATVKDKDLLAKAAAQAVAEHA